MIATLYTFKKINVPTRGCSDMNLVKVVRLTSELTDDWDRWPHRYIELYPELRLLGIDAIELVDDREAII